MGAARRHRRRSGLGRPAARRPRPGAADGGGAARHRGRRRGSTRPTGRRSHVRGQVAVATTPGRVSASGWMPDHPPACPEAVAAIEAADWVVLGPGSWFTSVLPHLLVPGPRRRAAAHAGADGSSPSTLRRRRARPRASSPENYLEVLAVHAPACGRRRPRRPAAVDDPPQLRGAAAEPLGARAPAAPTRRRAATARPARPTPAGRGRTRRSSGRLADADARTRQCPRGAATLRRWQDAPPWR